MAAITRLADLPGLKEPAAGLKRAAVVLGLVISWHDLPGLKEPAAGLKRAAVVFGLVIFL